MSESSEHYMSGMNEHDQLRALAVENQRLRAQLAEQPASRPATASITTPGISPHSLRRSFATTAIATGVPIRDVQITLRHASINTTTIYDRGGQNHDRNSTHRVASFVAGMAG